MQFSVIPMAPLIFLLGRGLPFCKEYSQDIKNSADKGGYNFWCISFHYRVKQLWHSLHHFMCKYGRLSKDVCWSVFFIHHGISQFLLCFNYFTIFSFGSLLWKLVEAGSAQGFVGSYVEFNCSHPTQTTSNTDYFQFLINLTPTVKKTKKKNPFSIYIINLESTGILANNKSSLPQSATNNQTSKRFYELHIDFTTTSITVNNINYFQMLDCCIFHHFWLNSYSS